MEGAGLNAVKEAPGFRFAATPATLDLDFANEEVASNGYQACEREISFRGGDNSFVFRIKNRRTRSGFNSESQAKYNSCLVVAELWS